MPSKTVTLRSLSLLCLALLAPHAAAGAPAGLGDFRITGAADDCPTGARCATFSVECPGLEPSTGTLTRHPAGEPRQLLIAHGGGVGEARWSEYGLGEAFVSRATARGTQVVEIQWDSNWMTAGSGDDNGLRTLSCRPATAIAWLHDREFGALERRHGGGIEMVWLGSSSGSLAAAYALAFHGADRYLDEVHLAGGPPLADVVRGCLAGQDDPYRTSDFGIRTIDRSYGYGAGGPCDASDASWAPRWASDSLLGPQAARSFDTEVHLYWGDRDPTSAPAHAALWGDHVRATGTEVTEYEFGGGHTIQDSRSGLRTLLGNLS